MKKSKIVALIMVVLLILSLIGCTTQTMTKDFGGTMEINLPANTKLEGITWKDANLWYWTRPMRADEEPETHTFQEQSEYGVFEGTVIIKESK